MSEITTKIRKIVEERCSDDWDMNYHLKPVVKYALVLAKTLGADKEIVEIAAWLHDITRLGGEDEEHHISSATEAEKILNELNYDKKKIQIIKHAILTHRSKMSKERKTVYDHIIASADAMAKFEDPAAMFYMAFNVKKLGVEEGKEWLRKKFEKSWHKMIPEAKELVKEKYDFLMNMLAE